MLRAAIEGSTVSSLICYRWLTRKLATFMGLTDSLECRFSCHDRRSVSAVGWTYSGQWSLALATWGWTCGEPLSRGAGGGASLDLRRTCEEGAEPIPCYVGAGLAANV